MPHIAPHSNLPPGSVVDAYVRDSGGPRQDASTDQQINELRAYCATYGLALRKIYADVAKSGKTTTGRDEFNNLIDSTIKPESRPAGLLLWNYSRFARELDDSTYYKSLLRKRAIVIHSLTDNIPEGQYGRVVEIIIDIANEEKRRQTSSDAKRGLRDLVEKFGCVPGVPPLGFIRKPVSLAAHRDGSAHIAHRWAPDPDLLPRIKSAFEMRAQGFTLREIHHQLHLYGALNSYKTFFANKIYIGILEFGDLTIENYCEPFVDLVTWRAVQDRIRSYAAARSTSQHPRRQGSPYIFSGMVYCGKCGSSMAGNTTTRDHLHGRDEAYRCTRARRRLDCDASRISRRALEDGVLDTLEHYILDPDSLGAIYEIESRAAGHREGKRTERIEAIAAEKTRLTRQAVNITRAIAERGHSTTLLDKLTELETQISQLKFEQAELASLRFDPGLPLTDDDIKLASKLIIATITGDDVVASRAMLKKFIERVDVKKVDGKLVGEISYVAPQPPPFDAPSQTSEAGYNLPIGSAPVGAHLYRQHFSHPIIFEIKKDHFP